VGLNKTFSLSLFSLSVCPYWRVF